MVWKLVGGSSPPPSAKKNIMSEKILVTEEWLRDKKAIEHKGMLLHTFSLDVSYYSGIYRKIEISLDPGNTYVYLREGGINNSRYDDDIITVFNKDRMGPLYTSFIEDLYKLLTNKIL
jgi:hypothetical protein